MRNKIIKWLGISLGIMLLLLLWVYLERRSLMQTLGDYLIEEDPPAKCEALFILSGGPVDRPAEAFRLFQAGYAPYIVCTGENVPVLFEVLDMDITESELSRKALNKLGMPDSLIIELHNGTSTREEAVLILNYCIANKLRKIMVVTDRFHTHRVNQVLRERLAEAGVEMVLRGAPSSRYREDAWWYGEAGLLMVNNEYVKLVYYFLSGLNK
ncbi:MAG: YdcF family protein [Bacteroidia bacterium]|nr:YdcF family protein [Bacteroidia bacterium]MCC6767854.1 YdcF family protein [Bacteroidia bacterium]